MSVVTHSVTSPPFPTRPKVGKVTLNHQVNKFKVGIRGAFKLKTNCKTSDAQITIQACVMCCVCLHSVCKCVLQGRNLEVISHHGYNSMFGKIKLKYKHLKY